MNQRYHQNCASRWEWWDRFTKISVGVLTVIALCLTFITIDSTSRELLITGAVVAVAGTVVAVALNLIPLGDWAGVHNALFQRWTDMREDIDALLFDMGDGAPSANLVDRLKDLEAKMHRICGLEPEAKESLLHVFYHKEVLSRRLEPTASPA